MAEPQIQADTSAQKPALDFSSIPGWSQIDEKELQDRTQAQAKTAATTQSELAKPWEDEPRLPAGPPTTKLGKAYADAKNWLSTHEQNLSEKYLKPFRTGLDSMAADLQQAGESGHTPTGGQLTGPTRALASGVGELLRQVPVGKDVSSTVLANIVPPELGPEGKALSKEAKAAEKFDFSHIPGHSEVSPSTKASAAVTETGWLTKDGRFESLQTGEGHYDAANRLGLDVKDPKGAQPTYDAIDAGHIRVYRHQKANASHFEAEGVNEQSKNVISKALNDSSFPEGHTVQLEFHKPKYTLKEFDSPDQAKEWLENLGSQTEAKPSATKSGLETRESIAQHIFESSPASAGITLDSAKKMLKADTYELKEIPVDSVKRSVSLPNETSRQYANRETPIPAIVLDSENNVIDGNHRITAATMRGEKTISAYVPVAEKRAGAAEEASQPVTVEYLHNTQKAPNLGSRFGQDVEPHGKYIIERTEGSTTPEGWESGKVTFKKPLVVDFGGGYQEASNWKNILSQRYEGKTGKALSDAIRKDGYDGIITKRDGQTREIVDLTERAAATTETLYHGSPDISKIDSLKPGKAGGYFGNGIYLARDPEVAQRFTKLESANPTLERNADGSFTDINTGKRVEGGKPGVLNVTLKDARLKKLSIEEMEAEVEKFRQPNGVINLDAARNAVTEKYAKQGYDGFDVPASKNFDEPQVLIFPKSAEKQSVTGPLEKTGAKELPAPVSRTPEEKARERQANLKGLGIGLTEMDPADAKNWVGYTNQKTLKVYRGVDDPAHSIQAGDYVTTSKDSAQNYGKHVQEIEVSPSDLRYVRGHKDGDPRLLDQGGQTEFIFAPKAKPSVLTPEGAQPLAEKLGAKIVGSVAKKGSTPKDLDLRIAGEYDHAATKSKLEDAGFEFQGSSVLSPKEIEKSGKEYGASGWKRIEHFQTKDGQKVDIFHDEPEPKQAKNPQHEKLFSEALAGLGPEKKTSARTSINASAESSASQEAISRAASEKGQGIKRFRVDTRTGKETPLFGPDAVDAKVGPYDKIIMRGPKGETVLDRGANVR